MGLAIYQKNRGVMQLLDGHFSRIRIHHDGGRVITIPTNGLRDGQKVAKTVLASFKRTRRAKGREELQETYNSEPHVESEKSSAAGALLHANLVLHKNQSRQAIPGPRRVIAGWSKHMGFFYSESSPNDSWSCHKFS